MKRHAVVMLAALSAVAAAAPAQSVPTTDVPALRTALYDDAAKPEQREQAAQRLLSRTDPAARDVLRGALQEVGRPGVQLAAARALADKPTPDPTLVTPLFALMDAGSNEALLDAVARALSAYKSDPGVLSQLIRLTSVPSEPVRLAAIRAVGTFIEKSAAATLVSLVEPGQSPRVTATASAALAYLSGLDPSAGAAGWIAWWEQNRNKPDAAFAADVARARAARFDLLRVQEEKLQDGIFRFASDRYQRAPRDERAALLLQLLNSPESGMRAVGCRIARSAADNDITPSAVKEQLRVLVGDSSPDVRRRAAAALAVINDEDAVVPILTQLNQENDSGVRVALVEALRPIRNPRVTAATPTLLTLLNDPSLETAQAAAVTLAEIGPQISAASASDANSTATAIMKVLKARTTTLGNTDLRNALIRAMASLRSPDVEQDLRKMLAQGEDRRVRRSLLTALGRYKKSDYAGDIVQSLRDRSDVDTLLVAIAALGESDPDFIAVQEPLARLIGPGEPQNVRDAAWKVLSGLFPKATREQLSSLEGKLASDPAKLVLVLVEQRSRAEREGKPDKVADRNQQLGDAYLGIERWADAVEAYRPAIAYRLSAGQPIEELSERMSKALLRSRQYTQWAEFTQQRLKESPTFQVPLGLSVRKEVARLIDEARDYDAAIDLIDRALKINSPALSESTRSELRGRQEAVQNRNRGGSSVPTPDERPIVTAMR